MTDRYYAATKKSYDHHGCTELWKTNDSLQLCADKGDPQGFGLTAYVAIDFVFDDSFLDDQRYESVRRITQDAFRKQWNKSFDALQKAMLHGGEYYIQKDDTGHRFSFHAFLRNPSRHYSITCTQEEECAVYEIEVEDNIVYRRGTANHSRAISETTFCKAYKVALEFFYDGSAMPSNHEKVWEVLDALGGSDEPEKPVLISAEYHYQTARELMLKRKEEIKFRLLELDDVPSKRRELRAEMKGIDYCVSILDKNH